MRTPVEGLQIKIYDQAKSLDILVVINCNSRFWSSLIAVSVNKLIGYWRVLNSKYLSV